MDEFFMSKALALAARAKGRTSPNPMVGAVVVRDGKIVGEGWHHKAGTPHAEVHALKEAGELASGATIYVTLEPCSHYGRTGPCSEAIIKAGLKKVVVAMTDPNPLVAGNGLRRLRDAGIEVVEGVLSKEAAKLNEAFIKWITVKMPFGVLKTAMTLDGKIASYTGHSKWITAPPAREYVHTLRNTYDAILTGIGTVLADDPALTTRLPAGGRNPIRIIVDSKARISLTAQVIQDKLAPTIIAVTKEAPAEKLGALEALGIEVLMVPEIRGRVDLQALFKRLAEKNITSILIEAGAKINAACLAANIIDKVYWFIAPKIIGGKSAPSPVGGEGIEEMSQALLLEDFEQHTVGKDILICGYVERREGRDVYRTCGRIG
ncbi:MAG: bifunctional diaminohydroxyphosphoribosylaminopyrimidine deaminase/5-amino-6-(5-phosphoribosylamino)uracil reductase RibD [Pelosinus sp.]|nr:bifunctional diaminohydroxyphosphoribosylaminopyrimidine deaminase/5-amino-6-(5-phosphoribosylamino)uracil reductase RibD [Pelosinus sp.]